MTFPKLEKAIRDACPETLELTFGCQVKLKDSDMLILATGSPFKNSNGPLAITYVPLTKVQNPTLETFNKRFEIIGHELTLAHVLRAMNASKKWPPYAITADGLFLVKKQIKANAPYVSCGISWDPTKDLDGQSDPTKEWLEKIICQ